MTRWGKPKPKEMEAIPCNEGSAQTRMAYLHNTCPSKANRYWWIKSFCKLTGGPSQGCIAHRVAFRLKHQIPWQNKMPRDVGRWDTWRQPSSLKSRASWDKKRVFTFHFAPLFYHPSPQLHLPIKPENSPCVLWHPPTLLLQLLPSLNSLLPIHKMVWFKPPTMTRTPPPIPFLPISI